MTREFCTSFDRHYMVRGLALYQSLATWCADFRLWVLCLDAECYEALAGQHLPGLVPIALADLERSDETFHRSKPSRSLVEYYFTSTACFALDVLNRAPEISQLTYLDADLFFFADPGPLFAEAADRSIAIIEHRFPARGKHRERFGRFNVGWLSFRRDRDGLACLERWRDQCLESCRDEVESGRFADQKYLDSWPDDFASVAILSHKGANLAPWNLENYAVTRRASGVWVDDQPLLFFHFHGLQERAPHIYETSLSEYDVRASRVVLRHIYREYVRALRDVRRRLGAGPLLGSARKVSAKASVFRAWRELVEGHHVLIWNDWVVSFER